MSKRLLEDCFELLEEMEQESKVPKRTIPWSVLVKDIQKKILMIVCTKDYPRYMAVCKEWKEMILDNLNHVKRFLAVADSRYIDKIFYTAASLPRVQEVIVRLRLSTKIELEFYDYHVAPFCNMYPLSIDIDQNINPTLLPDIFSYERLRRLKWVIPFTMLDLGSKEREKITNVIRRLESVHLGFEPGEWGALGSYTLGSSLIDVAASICSVPEFHLAFRDEVQLKTFPHFIPTQHVKKAGFYFLFNITLDNSHLCNRMMGLLSPIEKTLEEFTYKTNGYYDNEGIFNEVFGYVWTMDNLQKLEISIPLKLIWGVFCSLGTRHCKKLKIIVIHVDFHITYWNLFAQPPLSENTTFYKNSHIQKALTALNENNQGSIEQVTFCARGASITVKKSPTDGYFKI